MPYFSIFDKIKTDSRLRAINLKYFLKITIFSLG